MKKIIVASNPFGYGPTGQAIALIHELIKYRDSLDIYFIGSGLCLEIIKTEFKDERIVVAELNERDEKVLENYLTSFQNKDAETICIALQNRFIPKVAKKIGMKSVFVEGLGWFWDTIPEDHLVADRIYWTNFPNLDAGEKIIPKKVSVIGLLQDSFTWSPDQGKPYYIVSLGGCANPLRHGHQEYYLHFALKIFSEIYLLTKIPIKLALGNSARLFLENSNLIPPGVSVNTFDHQRMMVELAGCSHHFSIGGQSSTMEALISKVPTTFFLPSNMSQIAFQRVFNKFCSGNFYTHWESVGVEFKKTDEGNEAAIIDTIDQFSKNILNDEKKIEAIVEHCISCVYEPEKFNLFNIVRKLGCDGAKQIVSDLLNTM